MLVSRAWFLISFCVTTIQNSEQQEFQLPSVFPLEAYFCLQTWLCLKGKGDQFSFQFFVNNDYTEKKKNQLFSKGLLSLSAKQILKQNCPNFPKIQLLIQWKLTVLEKASYFELFPVEVQCKRNYMQFFFYLFVNNLCIVA